MFQILYDTLAIFLRKAGYKMKKITILTLIALMSVNLIACGNVKDKTQEKSVKTTEGKTNKNFVINLVEESNATGNFYVPNPEKLDKKVNITIHKCKYKKGSKSLYCTEENKEPKYDLSFLGFKHKVNVTNYAIGNVTGSGEDFVLVVKADSSNAYLVVLDYKNKKSYCVETDIIAGQGRDEQLNLLDVTGDGVDDLILSSEPNMTIDWNLYSFYENELKRIYSDRDDTSLGRDAFRAELVDNYKLKINGQDFKYSQTISLLDIGIKKKDLEINGLNNADKSDNQRIRVYNNGKIDNKKEAKAAVEISALMAEKWNNNFAEYDYFKVLKKDRTICTPLRVSLGDVEIGTINVYVQYDRDIKKLKIVDAKFKV